MVSKKLNTYVYIINTEFIVTRAESEKDAKLKFAKYFAKAKFKRLSVFDSNLYKPKKTLKTLIEDELRVIKQNNPVDKIGDLCLITEAKLV